MRSSRFLAALALVATGASAQTPAPSGTLTAFGTERELAAYLRQLRREAEAERRRWIAAATAPYAPCKGPISVSRRRMRGSDTAGKPAAVVWGRVRSRSGEPIEGTQLRIAALNVGALTAADGSYHLAVPRERLTEPADVALSARRIGFTTRERTIAIRPGDSVRVDVTMCAASVQLQALSVLSGVAEGVAREESVTNVQHEGVDEGGIVKLHGDHLVMLRRGRLFTVAIGGDTLRPVAAVDAFGPGVDPERTWYDELLVSGDRVVVVGYSYERGGTEIGTFAIDRDGGLRHLDTYHLRANDYYSSRNYASRLVGTKLLFYSPLDFALDDTDPLAALPAMRKWHPGAAAGTFRSITTPRRVYRAARRPGSEVALHTVTSCDLAAPELRCEATVVVGPPGRVFYVSPHAVYVWVSGRRRGRAEESVVYRMPLDGSAPSALGVSGTPVDQFSFLESEDGRLNVLVRSEALGEAMWGAERARGATALLRVPIADFGDSSAVARRSRYRALPHDGIDDGSTFQNRFVGDYLLYGSGNGWGRPTDSASTLYAVRWAGGEPTRLTLPHGTDRIEALGPGAAVVVGTDGRDLHFTGIRLDDGRPALAQRYVLANASQGELRSHGFFYKPDGTGAGLLGLPVRAPGRPGYRHLFDESASILFLRDDGSRFAELGQIESHPDDAADDACRASCVDWYGNARPLFVRGRILALLGYELVEGRAEGGRMRELRRVGFAPRVAEGQGR